MDNALALIFEADWALRELMKRSLRDAGFEALDSSTFVELDLKLRLRALRTATRALLVLGDVIATRAEPGIRALAFRRQDERLELPAVLLTRELGSVPAEPRSDLGGCNVIARLEKPFDLSLFQAIAFRYRTAPDAGPESPGAGTFQVRGS